MTTFDHDTYVVLDLPKKMAKKITAIREQYSDVCEGCWFVNSTVVEIGIVGSSGMGGFDPSQDKKEAFTLLDEIAAETAPIKTSFGKVSRFPDTDVFFLTLKNDEQFHALHTRIVNSDIRLTENPYPYKPHCTLFQLSSVSEETVNEILSLRVEGTFVLDTLSVYLHDTPPLTRLHQVKLTGERNDH